MRILADFFDPSNNGLDITDLIPPLAFVALIVGGIAGLWRLVAKPQIEQQIKDATLPIQPGTNGGKSLSDLHGKHDITQALVKDLSDRFSDHIEWHLDHKE